MTDAFLLVRHQSKNAAFDSMKISQFADRIAWDLIYNNDSKSLNSTFILSSSSRHNVANQPFANQPLIVPNVLTCNQHSPTSISTVTNDSEAARFSFQLDDLKLHTLGKNEEVGPNGRARRRKCKVCSVGKIDTICQHPRCKAAAFFCCTGKCFETHYHEMTSNIQSKYSK